MPKIVAWNRPFTEAPEITDTGTRKVVTHRAEFDGIPEYPEIALDDSRCPRLYSQWDNSTYIYVTALRPRRVAGIEHVIDIEVTYESPGMDGKAASSNGKPRDNSPLKWEMEVDWDSWPMTRVVDNWITYGKDKKKIGSDWEPILNTAGERIIFTQEENYRLLKCSKYVIQPDPIFAEGSTWVNLDTVTVEGYDFEPLKLLATKVAFSKRTVQNGFIVRKMSWEYRFNPETWLAKLDNVGYKDQHVTFSPGSNGTTDCRLSQQAILCGLPPQATSTPIPLLNMPNRIQEIIPNVSPGLNNLPISQYPKVPKFGTSMAPQGFEGAGVTNGDFVHGHAHPAFQDKNDIGQPILGKKLTPQAIALIFEQSRLLGLTRNLLAFKQYFPST